MKSGFKFRQAFFTKPAYTRASEELGFDLAQRSRENLKALQKQVGKLSSLERALFNTWREKIVPEFELLHATPRVEFDSLAPIGWRRKKGITVNNSHTNRSDARQLFSYFVLGFGTEHATPTFLGSSVDVIRVKIGQLLSANTQEELLGLWIGGHTQQYQQSEKTVPVKYGETERWLSFDKKRETKTYHYRTQTNHITREVAYADEIFAADKNLWTIFDALFFQFILETRTLSGSFKAYLYQNHANVPVIVVAFHSLFQSWIYPEAELPFPLGLKKSYITIRENTEASKILFQRWFDAARSLNLQKLQTCLQEADSLSIQLINAVNDDHEHALFLAVEATAFHSNNENEMKRLFLVINFLLENGADPSLKCSLNQTAVDLAIDQGNPQIIRWLLNLYQHALVPVIQSYASILPSHIQMAIDKKNKKLARWLLKWLPEFSFESQDAILALACEKKFNKAFYEALLEKGAPINARTDHGMTALMIAVQKQNLSCIQFLLEKGADPELAVLTFGKKLSPDEGRTAFHLAVTTGNMEIVSYFEKKGLAKNQADFYGRTPYASLAEIKDKSEEQLKIQNYLKEKGFPQDEAKPSLVRGCRYRKQCCVIVITGHIKDEWVVIAGRKKNILGKAEGYYVLPGGFKDPQDDSFAIAALREVKEETGLHFEIKDLKELYRLENREKETWIETIYFHIHWKNDFTPSQLRPGSDLAEICSIPWRQIEKKQFNSGHLGFYHRQHRIRQSNAMLINALAEQKLDQFDLNRWYETQALESFNSPEIFRKNREAFKNEDLAFYQHLYDQGTELCQTNLLHQACQYNKTKLISILLEYCGIPIDLIYRIPQLVYHTALAYYTPLMMAIAYGNIQQAKELVEKYNANIEIAQSGMSALTLACALDNDELVKYLIDHRPTVLSQGMGGVALLYTIVTDKSMKCFELLLAGYPQQAKIALNECYDYDKVSYYPLGFAILHKKTLCVQRLLEAGATIDLCLEELKDIKHQLDNEITEKTQRKSKNPAFSAAFFDFLNNVLIKKIDHKLIILLTDACAKSLQSEIKEIGETLDRMRQKLRAPQEEQKEQEDLGLAFLFK